MTNFLLEACDAVDACVFSGGYLEDPTDRAALYEFCQRWLDAIREKHLDEITEI